MIGSTTSLTNGWSASKHERDVADVNGDGFADLVGFGGSATYVALGNGDGSFQNLKRAHNDFSYQDNWKVDATERKLQDINGDGRADIVGFGTSQVYVALGRTDGTFDSVMSLTDLMTTNAGWNATDHERDTNDVDGNGFGDLVGFGNDGVSVMLYQGDALDGGRGNDTMHGGDGFDSFIFAVGDGLDVVADFENGTDRIQFSASELQYDDLQFRQGSSGAIIEYSASDEVRLNGISINQLNESDFIFL